MLSLTFDRTPIWIQIIAYKNKKVTWGIDGRECFGISPLNKSSSFSNDNAWGLFSSNGREVEAKYENKTYYWYGTEFASLGFNELNTIYYWCALIAEH